MNKVLTVCGNPDLRESNVDLLRSYGFDVTAAADAPSALGIYRKQSPGFVVIDYDTGAFGTLVSGIRDIERGGGVRSKVIIRTVATYPQPQIPGADESFSVLNTDALERSLGVVLQ